MKRKPIIIISIAIVMTAILWILYQGETAQSSVEVNKQQHISREKSTNNIKSLNEKVEKKLIAAKSGSKLKDNTLEIKEYRKFCNAQKLKYFSDEENVMDYIYDEFVDYTYVENQIEFLRIFATLLMDRKPAGAQVCLLDDYYKHLKTLMNAYKGKKINDEQRINFVKPILQGVITLSPSSQIVSLAIIRELIDYKYISSSYLYDSKDYMNKLKKSEDNYASGKMTKEFYESERQKLSDDISFLLLSIERSLQ